MSIQRARDLLPEVLAPVDWIAGALYKTVEGLKVLQNVTAAHINCAICFLVVAMISMLLAMLLGRPTGS